MSHKYKIRYDIDVEIGKFPKEDILKDGKGGMDAYILFSLIYPEDGSFSLNFTSCDGRNEGKELSDNEIFKVWSLLSSRLARSKTLSKNKKEFCEEVFNVHRQAMKAGDGSGA